MYMQAHLSKTYFVLFVPPVLSLLLCECFFSLPPPPPPFIYLLLLFYFYKLLLPKLESALAKAGINPDIRRMFIVKHRNFI